MLLHLPRSQRGLAVLGILILFMLVAMFFQQYERSRQQVGF